eukprot:51812-Eustigmatos_ZCMA.PRE.1
MYNAPLLPLLVVPELNTSRPLAPEVPALAVRMVTEPLLDALPAPVVTSIDPPVAVELSPDRTETRPPDPLLPLPTLRNSEPPRPEVATPLP